MKHYTVYRTTNLVTGDYYIGMHETNDPRDQYLGSGKRLRLAIQKYGKTSFRKDVLFDFDTETEMRTKEAELVTEEFCSRPETYNICSGGKGGFGYLNRTGRALRVGAQWSEESRQRMSAIKMGHSCSAETRQKMSKNNGMLQPKAQQKLSQSLTGRKLTAEHRQRVSDAIKKWHQTKRGIGVVEAQDIANV